MEPSREYVKKHLELADEFLQDANDMVDKGKLRSAIDRAYYSMFYGAHALLLSRKIRPPKTHRGLISTFGKEIIMKDLIEKEYGKMLSNAFKSRQISTYDVYAEFGKDRVKILIDEAERFIQRVKEIIQEK